METTECTLLQHLFTGTAIDKDWARKNLDELSRFVDYYEVPLHLWQCLEQDDSYIGLLAENQQVIVRFTGEIHRIAAVLKQGCIDYCILVGIPFAQRFFPLPDVRLQEDIDFFIRADDYEKVLLLMQELGYVTIGNVPSQDQKHQSFINEGFQKESTSLSGRNIIKFYLSLSLGKYFPTRFEDFADAITFYKNYPVLNDTATLVHLILHAHLYDLHPKVLADIYMVCRRGTVDWTCFWSRMQQLKAAFLAAVVLRVLQDAFHVKNIELLKQPITPAEEDMSRKFADPKWWNERHPVLSSEELTELRAYLTGNPDHQAIFARDVQNNLCRRVGACTKEFSFRGM
jgi:hypothetical protein